MNKVRFLVMTRDRRPNYVPTQPTSCQLLSNFLRTSCQPGFPTSSSSGRWP